MDLYQIRQNLALGKTLDQLSLRVTDYARVSTDHKEQKKSLQNQIEHFKDYILSNPNWTYIEGYVDAGITGTSDIKRDQFMKMIEDAKQDKFDLIITKEISRFSRNTLDSIKYTRELLKDGVAVLFVNDNINTALPDSELRLTIMASMAQDEIRRLSERVKFGMNRAMEKGEILGNNHLYGYQKNKVTKNLEQIPAEAEVVKYIYELYGIREYSLSKISKILKQRHIQTKENKNFCVSTLSRMIENPKYKGYYCARKSEIVDYMTKKVKYFKNTEWIVYENKQKIPPIVSEELWKRANRRLEERKEAFAKRKKTKKIYKNRYLYSAKIFCKNDQSIFHRREFRKIGKEGSWLCSTYLKEGKKICDSPNLRENELNEILKDIIEKWELNVLEVIPLLMENYSKMENRKEENQKVRELKKREAKILSKKEKLLDLSLEKLISNREFQRKNESLSQEEKKIKERLKRIENQGMDKDLLIKKIEEELKTEEIWNEIISSVLEKIVVSKIENQKDKVLLEIYFNYRESKNQNLNRTYNFPRGYDTKGTRRYQMTYQVNCFYK